MKVIESVARPRRFSPISDFQFHKGTFPSQGSPAPSVLVMFVPPSLGFLNPASVFLQCASSPVHGFQLAGRSKLLTSARGGHAQCDIYGMQSRKLVCFPRLPTVVNFLRGHLVLSFLTIQHLFLLNGNDIRNLSCSKRFDLSCFELLEYPQNPRYQAMVTARACTKRSNSNYPNALATLDIAALFL